MAMLPGVTQELARVLRRMGAPDINSLLSSFDVSRLSEVSVVTGGRSGRVGKAAHRILAAAHAFHGESEIWIERSAVLTDLNVVVMDFEGMPPYLESPEFVFLFGMQVFGVETGTYLPSVITNGSLRPDEAWSEFLLNAESVLDKFGDIPFIHWHHYEPTMIRKYVDRFGDRNGTAARILNNAVDLLPLLQSKVVLPTPSYSLKTVEKHIGFSRGQTEYGGDWAMAQYVEALMSNDEDERARRVSEILTYNQEDLRATFAVLAWLRSQLEG